MEESITVAYIVDCPVIMVHAGKHYKALIDSGADILLWYSTYKNIGDSYKTPIHPTIAKLNTADGFPITALGTNSFTLKDSGIQIHPQFCNLQQTPGYRDYFQYRHTKEVFSFICLGQGKKLLYTKGWKISHLHMKL